MILIGGLTDGEKKMKSFEEREKMMESYVIALIENDLKFASAIRKDYDLPEIEKKKLEEAQELLREIEQSRRKLYIAKHDIQLKADSRFDYRQIKEKKEFIERQIEREKHAYVGIPNQQRRIEDYFQEFTDFCGSLLKEEERK